jgi:predicted CXXCH cytochrome family protein
LIGRSDHAGFFCVEGRRLPAAVRIDQVSDAPSAGLHRIEPGAALSLSISLRPETILDRGSLVETLPQGWQLVDADDGQLDATASTVTWPLASVPAGTTLGRVLRFRAPSIPPGGPLTLAATFSVRLEQGSARSDGPDLAVLVAPRVVVAGTTAGRVAGPGADATYLAPNAPLAGEQRYEVFRLRFDVRNADTLPVRWTPQLEFQPAAGGAFAPVPAGAYRTGVAFYAAPEWTRNGRGGTSIGPPSATAEARPDPTDLGDGLALRPVEGMRGMGLNPLPTIVLPALSRSVVEFSVRATSDAPYLSGYDFRVTDGGETFAGAAAAEVELGPEPTLVLSPGQRVGRPSGATGATPPTPVRFALSTPATADQPTPGEAPAGSAPLRYALVPPSASATTTASSAPLAQLGSLPDPIHGPAYGLTSDTCAACHSAHRASGAGTLLTASPPQLGPCGSCHDGVLALDIQAGYAAAPSNDPVNRAYYQHDPAQVTGHTADGSDALAGQLNRHAECADCHNPHNSTATAAVEGSPGWSASGRIAAASGVTTTNGSPGSAPTYALTATTALEYQLCLKCHSGYTQLPSNAGQPPSRYALDKGVEFNPANLSYHPVEAPGTNDTSAMAYSLSGTSPFKQWTFTTQSTVRCVNCHADPRALTSPTSGGTPVAVDSSLPVHASTNRGILVAPYQDRQLKAATEAYDSKDFALCYLCHAEAPFRDTTGEVRDDTNFRYHGVHVSGSNLLDHGSSGTDIDTPGDGGGLAICSECHFRIHSTSFAVNDQPGGSRLVNFAPDVLAPTGGSLDWRVRTETVSGGCTLKCHGQPHAADY